MQSIACSISYGRSEIEYRLFKVKRKTLEISVLPDQSVVVKAPHASPFDDIEKKVRKRAKWIKKQISYFKQFDPRTPKRRYVSGETHLYLGRRFRLKVAPAKSDSVLLKNGRFFIETKRRDPRYIKAVLDQWYTLKAKIYFMLVFEDCWSHFKHAPSMKPRLRLQYMKKRWGSLSPKGQMTLNVNLIQAPKECIEYVIYHELCHLTHRNHDKAFYDHLEKMLPDWPKRKLKLEMALV